MKERAMRLLADLETVGFAMEDVDSLCTILRQFQGLPFPAGVHSVLKHFSHMFPLHSPQSLFSQLQTRLSDLLPDLISILLTDHPSETRPILPAILQFLLRTPTFDLRTLTIFERLFTIFPEIDNSVYESVLKFDCQNEFLQAKVENFYWKLAHYRKILKATDVTSIESRFLDVESADRMQLLMDLYWISYNSPSISIQTALFSPQSTVRSLLESLSTCDYSLLSASLLLISLGKDLTVLEMDAYSVFYHFLCLFGWDSKAVFACLEGNEALFTEFLTAFLLEAEISWRKWRQYVYIMHIYAQRKRDVDGFLCDFCEIVSKERKRLRISPSTLISKIKHFLAD